MASKFDKKNGCDFADEVKKLKASGPAVCYLLHGPEDYLREYFLNEIKKICLPNGDDGFSYKRFDGPSPDDKALRNAVDSFPFLSDRTLVEIRDADINKLSSDVFSPILENIPETCTVVFVQSAGYVPDGRLKLVKTLKSVGKELYFAEQPQKKLFDWIRKRFKFYGKDIDMEALQRLVFVSGELMNRLIPEIEKVASYAAGDVVHAADVDAVAYKIPEAQAFDMINFIAERQFESAMKVFAELIRGKDNNPIAFISSLGFQFRRMYGAKLALYKKKSKAEIMELLKIKNDYAYEKLISAAKRFSFNSLINSIQSCVDAEYRMKSSGVDNTEIMKDVLTGIITGE